MTDITIHSIEKKIKLPSYSRGEELINTISHGVGAALGLCALILCLPFTMEFAQALPNEFYVFLTIVPSIY